MDSDDPLVKLSRDIVERTVAHLITHEPTAQLVGIRGAASWTGEQEIKIGKEHWCLAACRTRLEMSTRLAHLGDERLVLVTPLDDAELGMDVLSRLARQRLHEVQRWELVKARFSAQHVDPRVPLEAWLGDLLLAPIEPSEAVAGGWLDEDTVWRNAFSHAIALDSGKPDVASLLRWSLDENLVSRYEQLPEDARAGFTNRLTSTLGKLSNPVLGALGSGHGAALLPLGLVCEVLFPEPPTPRKASLKQAVVRLESSLGGHALTLEEGQNWKRAAIVEFERLSETEREVQLQHAASWLETLKISDQTTASALFRSGFELRLVSFATILEKVLDGDAEIDSLQSLLGNIQKHREADLQSELMARLHMAMRTLRWLASDNAQPNTLSGFVHWHAEHGAFVDWARRHLLGAESPIKLAASLATLRLRVQRRRDDINMRFATLLAQWSKAPSDADVTPVEHFLDDVVCRLPPKQRALILVLDGMDGGTFAELAEDIERQGWVRHAAEYGIAREGMLAVLPTVTAFSRTALLTGQLGPGDANKERKGFAAHKGLAARSRSAPVLLHKGALSDDGVGGLSVAARDAIADANAGVVGVVINAVDDHLAKTDQLRLHWNVASFRLLGALLNAAEESSRAVIFTADHGHVLEADTETLGGSDEERWRSDDVSVGVGEIEITGTRLERGTGLDRAVLLSSERYRYCRRKTGYHGGATLQEVVVPLAVYTRVGTQLSGWQELPPATPDWWFTGVTTISVRESVASVSEAPETPTPRRATAKVRAQTDLFDENSSPNDAPDKTTSNAVGAPRWLDALLASDIYRLQRESAKRMALPDELLCRLLSTLTVHGNRLPITVLARTLEVPAYRMNGMLAGLRKVLNLDGFPIISVEEQGADADADCAVTLDLPLLRRQFELYD